MHLHFSSKLFVLGYGYEVILKIGMDYYTVQHGRHKSSISEYSSVSLYSKP